VQTQFHYKWSQNCPINSLVSSQSIYREGTENGVSFTSHYMLKPPKPIFNHIYNYRCYSNTHTHTHTPSNSVISNQILSGLTTRPTQHPNLYYAYFILVFDQKKIKLYFIFCYKNSLYTIRIPYLTSL